MNRITKIAIAITTIAFSAIATAQNHPLERPCGTSHERTEIIIPKVKGCNVYKADLHIHTIYSDGEVTPDARVVEAWHDGLDVIAITDHMEYRRIEREMFKYMNNYIREDLRNEEKAVNTNVLTKPADERGILVDLNVPYESAVKKARNYGLLVIRGVEITRKKLGDYNALFTTDNNKIYDPDLEQTIRNARAQGAFIIHNHPMFDKKSPNTITPFTNDLYAKGLIDGIEVANSVRMYPHLFSYCIDGGYTPCGDSDAHSYIDWRYRSSSAENNITRYRNMTLILAKDLTEKALHKALKEGNTIAYHNNNLIGKRQLLEELFKASVKFTLQRTGSADDYITVTNHSSLPYYVQIGKSKHIINGMGSLFIKRKKSKNGEIKVTVLNMWHGDDLHPSVYVKLK